MAVNVQRDSATGKVKTVTNGGVIKVQTYDKTCRCWPQNAPDFYTVIIDTSDPICTKYNGTHKLQFAGKEYGDCYWEKIVGNLKWRFYVLSGPTGRIRCYDNEINDCQWYDSGITGCDWVKNGGWPSAQWCEGWNPGGCP